MSLRCKVPVSRADLLKVSGCTPALYQKGFSMMRNILGIPYVGDVRAFERECVCHQCAHVPSAGGCCGGYS